MLGPAGEPIEHRPVRCAPCLLEVHGPGARQYRERLEPWLRQLPYRRSRRLREDHEHRLVGLEDQSDIAAIRTEPVAGRPDLAGHRAPDLRQASSSAQAEFGFLPTSFGITHEID